MFRCICRHALFPFFVRICVRRIRELRARVGARVRARTCEVTCRPLVRSRLVQAEGCFSVRGLNVLLLNHNARGRVFSRWNLARGEATRKRKAEGGREGGRVMGEGENSWNYYYSTT